MLTVLYIEHHSHSVLIMAKIHSLFKLHEVPLSVYPLPHFLHTSQNFIVKHQI